MRPSDDLTIHGKEEDATRTGQEPGHVCHSSQQVCISGHMTPSTGIYSRAQDSQSLQ